MQHKDRIILEKILDEIDIAGFRDIAAHKYGTLDMTDVYDTVTNDFPALKSSISKLLS